MKQTITSLCLLVLPLVFISCDKNTGISPDIGKSPTVFIKANVKIEIGDVLYENVDAHINVNGYDVNNAIQWSKVYNYAGPSDNILEVQNGFHHYSLELVNKWGTYDIQSEIPAKAIWDGRADGPLPVTYVLTGSKNAKKLSSYVTSREINIQGTGIVYQPDFRVRYTYTGDHMQFIHYGTYNPQTLEFDETKTDAFTYEGEVVSKITTTLNGQLYSEDHYTYGIENKITETNYFNNGLVSTQTSKSNDNANSVTVDYVFSNGNSFSYNFDFLYKNIVSDKTTESGLLCNQGTYGYDKNINPFHHLGFMDFNLQNWSASNKLTENVDYKACSFPEIRPVAHDYTYDQDGYPVIKITSYKSADGDPNPTSPYHSKIEFFYE